MSVNRVETEFRRIESRLDEMVGKAEPDFRSVNVRVQDCSDRNYHYKNEHRSWSHSFLKEWDVGVERARITVRISYTEPLNPEGLLRLNSPGGLNCSSKDRSLESTRVKCPLFRWLTSSGRAFTVW